MFSTKDKKNETGKSGSLNPASSGHSLNSIVKGTSIEGTIKASSDIRIDGSIKGKLYGDAKVIIGPTGSVEGEIKCQNAVIEGKFDGMLVVKELLNVREKAVVNGEVTTHKIIIQSGAIFNATCSMGAGSKNAGLQNKHESVKAGKPVGA